MLKLDGCWPGMKRAARSLTDAPFDTPTPTAPEVVMPTPAVCRMVVADMHIIFTVCVRSELQLVQTGACMTPQHNTAGHQSTVGEQTANLLSCRPRQERPSTYQYLVAEVRVYRYLGVGSETLSEPRAQASGPPPSSYANFCNLALARPRVGGSMLRSSPKQSGADWLRSFSAAPV